jgi:hypothetical protein
VDVPCNEQDSGRRLRNCDQEVQVSEGSHRDQERWEELLKQEAKRKLFRKIHLPKTGAQKIPIEVELLKIFYNFLGWGKSLEVSFLKIRNQNCPPLEDLRYE